MRRLGAITLALPSVGPNIEQRAEPAGVIELGHAECGADSESKSARPVASARSAPSRCVSPAVRGSAAAGGASTRGSGSESAAGTAGADSEAPTLAAQAPPGLMEAP